MNIGEKLLRLRKQRQMTLEEISRKAGVGKATLSRIENNITAGTLKTHMKICEALNINLKDLYEDLEVPKEEISVLDQKEISDSEVFSYDEKTNSVILTKQAQKKNMLPRLTIIQPAGKTHLEQDPTGTECFVYCLEGDIEIKIENKSYCLKKDNSLYFGSFLPHQIINIGKRTAKCIVVKSPVVL